MTRCERCWKDLHYCVCKPESFLEKIAGLVEFLAAVAFGVGVAMFIFP